MPRRSRVFSGIFPVEMASWMFQSQHRDKKATFYLFYKITKAFSSIRDAIHVSVLSYKMKMTSAVTQYSDNEARPIRARVGCVLFYN